MGSMSAGANYYFSVGSAGSPLPVELSYFNVKWNSKEQNQAVLEWQTASEINNSHFEIERSFNGVDYIKIGEVEGNGTTYNLSQYQFSEDLNGVSDFLGIVYYRLKQMDYDGKYEYSQVRILNSDGKIAKEFRAYPNPTSQRQIRLSVFGDYEVYNLQGVLLKEFLACNQLDLSEFSSGTYLIRSATGNSQVLVLE
jgi:hypothetical protein